MPGFAGWGCDANEVTQSIERSQHFLAGECRGFELVQGEQEGVLQTCAGDCGEELGGLDLWYAGIGTGVTGVYEALGYFVLEET